MKNGNKEFLNLSCNLYIAAMLTALPLYTGQGYWQLGNTKYVLFRNITVLCLGSWLAVGLPGRLWAMAEKAGGRIAGGRIAGQDGAADGKSAVKDAVGRIGRSPGLVDLAVAAYGVTVLLSALCSSYGELAWRGYEGWFMGAFSQLLFVGIYFFVSRQQDGSLWPLHLGEAALVLATVLGLLHRLGVDPLGLMEGWNSGDWEYSHMLSTLGNINWLCGYYSVALAVLTAHFLQEKRRAVSCILYIAAVLSFVLLGVQGSQGGWLILAVCAGGSLVCGALGGRLKAVAERICLVGAGFCLGMPLMWKLMLLRGKKAAIVADGNIFDHVEWYVWGLGAAVCIVLYFLIRKGKRGLKENPGSGGEELAPKGQPGSGGEELAPKEQPGSGTEKRARKEDTFGNETMWGRKKILIRAGAGCGSAVCAAACILVCCLAGSHVADGFGSGRGLLWRICVESFRQADWKDRLLGAGPDCYAEAVFDRLGTGTEVWKGEHWEGAVFTNAHNEVLSQLCNVGIVGTVSYLMLFLAAFWQYGCSIFLSRRRAGSGGRGEWIGWVGVLAPAMYGAYALISFQQVLSTPLLFLMLGLCEARRRRSSVSGS